MSSSMSRRASGSDMTRSCIASAAQLRIAEEPLSHALEAARHVLHGGFLGDLHEDRLAGCRGHRFDLAANHLDPFAAQAFALEPAVAELPAEAVEGSVDR